MMLPPEQSSWQARVHNKFEGFHQGHHEESHHAFPHEIAAPPTARPANRVSQRILVMEGGDPNGEKLSSIDVAQFRAAPFCDL